jgi:hypothetical protein
VNLVGRRPNCFALDGAAQSGLAQSEEREDDPDHNDQADDINDAIHGKLLSFTARGIIERPRDGSPPR